MSQSVAARFFGPGAPVTGASVTIECSRSALKFHHPDGQRVQVPGGLRLRRIGLDMRGLEIAWSDGADASALQVVDPIAAEQVLAALPDYAGAARDGLLREQRRTGYWRGLGFTALIGVLLVPVLLVVVLVWQASRFAEWVLDWIPPAHDRQIGELSFAQMRPHLDLLTAADPRTLAVTELGGTLAKGSQWTYEFHVAVDPSVNAFALPGGIVVVHTGLIEATRRPEELAGVLAHEIQHVESRHGVAGMVKSLGFGLLWAIATGDLSGTLVGQLGAEYIQAAFSREAEREADMGGLKRLHAAGLDPSGMADFFQVLAGEEGNLATATAWFSTHPLSREREQNLQAAIEELPQRPYPPLPAQTWPPSAP